MNDKMTIKDVTIVITIFSIIILFISIISIVIVLSTIRPIKEASISIKNVSDEITLVADSIKKVSSDIEINSAIIKTLIRDINNTSLVEDIRNVLLHLEKSLNDKNVEEIQKCFSHDSEQYLELELLKQSLKSDPSVNFIKIIFSVFGNFMPDIDINASIINNQNNGVTVYSFRDISISVDENNAEAFFTMIEMKADKKSNDLIVNSYECSFVFQNEHNEWKIISKLNA